MPPEITIYDGRRTRAWWDGGAFSARCRGCDGGGSFSMGYCGEPHLREPCYDCDSTGFREHSWAAIRRARRERRRELRRAARQRLRLRSGARLRRRLAAAVERMPCWCDTDAMLVAGVPHRDECDECGDALASQKHGYPSIEQDAAEFIESWGFDLNAIEALAHPTEDP